MYVSDFLNACADKQFQGDTLLSQMITTLVRVRSSYFCTQYSMSSPLATLQPLVLMNRFIINLRSLNNLSSSQGSSARQHWSRFSTPNFHIPDSFLGNIGEDLQEGHEPANADCDGHHETGAARLNTERSLEAELEETSTTPDPSTSRPMVAQVSLQI